MVIMVDHANMLRMCLCILHSMSVDPRFGTQLNRPFVEHGQLPASVRLPSFSGTYNDFLIIVRRVIFVELKRVEFKLVNDHHARKFICLLLDNDNHGCKYLSLYSEYICNGSTETRSVI